MEDAARGERARNGAQAPRGTPGVRNRMRETRAACAARAENRAQGPWVTFVETNFPWAGGGPPPFKGIRAHGPKRDMSINSY